MQKKIEKKFFVCGDTSIWIGGVKLSLLRKEYLPSAFRLLGKCLEILYVTNRHFLEVNYLQSDQQIWERCCHANFNNFWARLPCCFPKDLLKRDFLDIDLTLYFRIRNLEIPQQWDSSFFWKCSKFKLAFKNGEKS